MDATVKRLERNVGYQPRYSTRAHIARLHQRLEVETDRKLRKVIEARLAAFERPPRGGYD
jgi:hypothetical protein